MNTLVVGSSNRVLNVNNNISSNPVNTNSSKPVLYTNSSDADRSNITITSSEDEASSESADNSSEDDDSSDPEYYPLDAKVRRVTTGWSVDFKDTRRDILAYSSTFTGEFGKEMLDNTSPESLRTVVSSLIDGDPASRSLEKSAICDIIVYNCRNAPRKRLKTMRRSQRTSRETPHFQYVSFKIYKTIPSRGLVDFLHEQGMCMGYQRMRRVLERLTYQSLMYFKANKAMVPLELKDGLFLVGAVDNIDKQARNTSGSPFHGTTMCLFQQELPGSPGVTRVKPPLLNVPTNFKFELDEIFKLDREMKMPKPTEYFYHANTVNIDNLLDVDDDLKMAHTEEREWLQHVHEQLTTLPLPDKPINTSCFVFHANKNPVTTPPKTIVAGLPVQFESPASLEMQRHCIDIVTAVRKVVNPAQTVTVDVKDQPLYALSKILQLTDQRYGLGFYFVMMGPLHVEQVILKLLIVFLMSLILYYVSKYLCSQQYRVCPKKCAMLRVKS